MHLSLRRKDAGLDIKCNYQASRMREGRERGERPRERERAKEEILDMTLRFQSLGELMHIARHCVYEGRSADSFV